MDSSIPSEVLHALPSLNGSEIATTEYAIPTVTFICASCERIIGDSSTLLFLHRKQLTLTFTQLISVSTSLPIQFSPPGEWDENCTFHRVTCEKCHTILGKKHLATTYELGQFQNRYTVSTDRIGMYYHGALEPAAQPAELAEVLRVLHPDPDEVVEQMQSIMSVCVGLSENVGELARVLKKVAAAAGLGVGAAVARLAGEAEVELLEAEKDDVGEITRALLSRVDRMEETVKALKEAATFEHDRTFPSAKRKRHAYRLESGPPQATDDSTQSADENPPLRQADERQQEPKSPEIEPLPSPSNSRQAYHNESQPSRGSYKKRLPKGGSDYDMQDSEEEVKSPKRKALAGGVDARPKRTTTRSSAKKK